MRTLRLFISLIDQLNDAVGRVVSWFTVVMVVNVFLVVTLRYVFLLLDMDAGFTFGRMQPSFC